MLEPQESDVQRVVRTRVSMLPGVVWYEKRFGERELPPGVRAAFWRSNVGVANRGKRPVRFGVDGLADLTGLLRRGRFIFIELKRPRGGVLSDDQLAFRDTVEALGGLYLCSSNPVEVVSFITRSL